MSTLVGRAAPNFKLYNSEKEQVSLSDFKGKNVILLFFPQAFTGVCTEELCSMRDNIGVYENLNAQILAVSVDSVFTLGKFKSEQNYNFPLLSDFNKEVISLYGAKYDNWILDMKGVAKRSVFVIDKDGVVQHAEILESAGDMPDFNAVKAALEAIA